MASQRAPIVIGFFILALCIVPISANAITVVRSLDFGEAVVTDNSASRSIHLSSAGHYTAEAPFIVIEAPQAGTYKLNDLPPSTAIAGVNVSIEQQMEGPGEDFVIDNFDVDAPSSTTPDGELTIHLGARLQTSGNGQAYQPDSRFESVMMITVQY